MPNLLPTPSRGLTSGLLKGHEATLSTQDSLANQTTVRTQEPVWVMTVEHFDEQLEVLRIYYGLQKPEFVQKKETLAIGQSVRVVEASTGRNDPSFNMVTAEETVAIVKSWDRTNIFWILDLGSERYIVTPLRYKGRTAFQRWWGIERGFDGTIMAYAKESTELNGLDLPEKSGS